MNVNTTKPLVTVIAACYNQSKYLLDTLESIKAQTYNNIELVFWDDCSSDDSVEKIDNWLHENKLDCTFIKHSKNMGVCKSVNEAFSYAKGKYVQLVSMDDILLPDKIKKQVEMLENSAENVAFVFSDALLIDSEGKLYQNRFIAYHKKYLSIQSGNFFDELLEGNYVPSPTCLKKTEAIRAIGAWDESLSFEDYDLTLRLARSYDFMYDETPTVKYRLHETNLSKNIPDYEKSLFFTFIKHVDTETGKIVCEKILKTMYLKGVDTNQVAKLYFEKNVPSEFMLKCIKIGLSVRVFKFFNSIYK